MSVSIAEVSRAPGKGMRAQIDVEALLIDEFGMFGDREYMWVEARPHNNTIYKVGNIADTGHFISQREDPVLTGIVPTLYDNGLGLRWHTQEWEDELFIPRADETAENVRPVSVWGWHGRAIDQGDQAADWGSHMIGREVRLVAVSDSYPRYVEDNPALGRVGFADGYPLLVSSQASLDELNRYLVAHGKPPVPNDRFRGSIHLDGLEPFQEDYIDEITVVHHGMELVLKRLSACGRCPVPDTDQLTGDRKQYVRSALGKLGRSGHHLDTAKYGDGNELFYGQNFIIKVPADIHEWDTIPVSPESDIKVSFSDSTNWQS